jgi:hypothetical protein
MNDQPSADAHKAVKATIAVARFVIGAGLIFLFIQLVADIGVSVGRGCDARGCSTLGSYSVGLVILMIGAALLLVAIVASRPPRLPAQDRDDAPLRGPDGVPPPVVMPTEVSVSVKNGPPS